ncbi:MAG: YmdB family metallophosphoesterase [Oscillospiraceae bacterium]|nr:YmdB family metallophosphoesterase [Oscillospiraceae bacterium]
MVILAIGDICADNGVNFLRQKLPHLRKLYDVDLVLANGENSATSGIGINEATANRIFTSGVDIITTGNHAFNSTDYLNLYENTYGLLRPYNLGKGIPGQGNMVYDKGRYQVQVVNLLGCSYMSMAATNFYDAMDEILTDSTTPIIIVDFHAEYTSEKIAFARSFDGQLSMVYGTHTHVQTADECILPNGTAYITDIGMTGAKESVIGVDIQKAIERQRYATPTRMTPAKGPSMLQGVLAEIDEKSGIAVKIQRLQIEE